MGAAQGPSTSLCVTPDGSGGCVSTIQAAVASAAPGAIVSVAPGVYRESVTIATPLTLRGTGSGTSTVNAGGADNAIHIVADGVRIEGLTVTGSRLDGILVNANRAQIVNNVVTENASLVIPAPPGQEIPSVFNQINLQNASDALVADNVLTGSEGRGIRTEGSAAYQAPEFGVEKLVMGRSDRNVIINNRISDNIGGCGIVLSTDSSNNVVIGNTINNNATGLVISNIPPFGLPNTPFADHIPHSDGNVVMNNTIVGNFTEGLAVHPIIGIANGNVVSGNTVRDNGPGPVTGDDTVGIYVWAGPSLEGPFPSTAIGTVVGPGNVLSGQAHGIFVGGEAVNTQVFGNEG
jgi:parallel beta-helix repeat protein